MTESSSSQTNHIISQYNHSNRNHNKEPFNVKVQQTIEKQSQTIFPKKRKTSPDQSAYPLGDKKQSKDSMQKIYK